MRLASLNNLAPGTSPVSSSSSPGLRGHRIRIGKRVRGLSRNTRRVLIVL